MAWINVKSRQRTMQKTPAEPVKPVKLERPAFYIGASVDLNTDASTIRALYKWLLQKATNCPSEEIPKLAYKYSQILLKKYRNHQTLSESEKKFLKYMQNCYNQLYKTFSKKEREELANTGLERLQLLTDDGYCYEQRRLAENESSNSEFDNYVKCNSDMKNKRYAKLLRKKSDRRMAVILQKSHRRAKVAHKKPSRGATSRHKACRKAMSSYKQ